MKKLSLLFFLTALMQLSFAQQNKKTDKQIAVKNLIDSSRFIFYPQTAMPMRGNVQQVTPDFDITITKDTIICYLPYYGRAYSAGYGDNTSPLNFTSTKFNYTVKEKTKGGWDISIITKDTKENTELNLSVSVNGYGSLRASSNNREPISFTGYITERKINHQ